MTAVKGKIDEAPPCIFSNDFNITPDFVGEGTGQEITVKYGDGTNQTLYQYRTKLPVESTNLSFSLT